MLNLAAETAIILFHTLAVQILSLKFIKWNGLMQLNTHIPKLRDGT